MNGLAGDRLQQKEESVLKRQLWKKQALCLPAVLMKNYAGLHSRSCDWKIWFDCENESLNTEFMWSKNLLEWM
jgi:hypothetical protein